MVMGGEMKWGAVSPVLPAVAPLNAGRQDQNWSRLDDSVNAVSFGFVATAILISMFLLMAIFEKFLRSRSPLPPVSRSPADLEAQTLYGNKPHYPSPKMTVYSRGVSVLMPGEEIPTFIAHPAPPPPPPPPPPCPPEPFSRPLHQHYPVTTFCPS